MSQKLIKELGKEDTCPICKAKVKCNQVTYQGETKLQWQNADGKAHYKFNAETQKTSCNTPIPQIQGESNIKDQSLLLKGGSYTPTIEEQIQKIYDLEMKVKETLMVINPKNIPLEEKVRFYVKLLYK